MKTKFVEVPNFKKAMKKITAYKKKLDNYRNNIKKFEKLKDTQEELVDKFKLDLYGISVRNADKGELDLIHITGFCEYEGKAGFRYESVYQYSNTMDNIGIEKHGRWFITSVNRDYRPISKAVAIKTVAYHILIHNKAINKIKQEFFSKKGE